jgi:hypothetical protein
MEVFMKILFSFLSLALLVSCAKDKTLEEYDREKARNEMAEYQAVAGNYSGIVTSKESGEILGAMEVTLETDTKPAGNNSSGQLGNALAKGTPILTTNVRFLDSQIISLASDKSYYDPDTGAFSVEFLVRKTGEGIKTVFISGNINGSGLLGQIATREYPASGGKFALTKNGRSIEQLLKEARPNQPDNKENKKQVRAFIGSTEFTRAEEFRPVRVVMLQPIKGNEEDLLDVIDPVKKVQLSFNYSQTLNLLFPNATFDVRQNLITGEITFTRNGQSQQMSLECNLPPEGSLSCVHFTTGSGKSAITSAKSASWDEKDPKDTGARKPKSKIFSGKGRMSGELKPIKLAVTEPVRSQLEDLYELYFPNSDRLINATVNFSEVVNPTFTGARWDRANGILDGQFTAGNNAYTAYLECENFYFLDSKEPFSCRYWTSRSKTIEMEFKPN